MSSREIVFAAAGASGPATYIEDVFSTYLYTGNGSTQTISNGIDLAGKGGLVWTKRRSGALSHYLVTTPLGTSNYLSTDSTNAQGSTTNLLTPTSTGFDFSSNTLVNANTALQVAWTFAKQPKFFDVVTYTGNGASSQTISHSLGSVPGMIIVKGTNTADNWLVYHRSTGATKSLLLNTTAAAYTGTADFPTTPTSSVFYVGDGGTNGYINQSGVTYVAYLFAHNAGGFGTSGTDNVISCGSFSPSGYTTINLGFEPQWILFKRTDNTQNWYLWDTMRGMSLTGGATLQPNLSSAEYSWAASDYVYPTATGFVADSNFFGTGSTVIYMAIRRPMKVPTDATTVFSLATRTGTGSTASITGLTSTPDALLCSSRDGWSSPVFADRLRGFGPTLVTVSTSAEGFASDNLTAMGNTSITFGADSSQGYMNWSGKPYVNWMFSRRPGFFDEVCYTGTGASRTLTHNLTVAPELIIIKSRSGAYSWSVGSKFTSSDYVYNTLESTDPGYTFAYTAGVVFNGQPSASSVFLNSSGGTNGSGDTFVMYLFATCPGVSKVGSYTGTGATQTINCGFTGGARFVLIKRTDSTGAWYVWDTARGMVAGTDPSLLLNSIAAEVNANSIYTATTGFQIVSTSAGINASGGSYIYMAIA